MDEAEIEEAGGDEEADDDDDGVGVEGYEDGVGDGGHVTGGGADEDYGEGPVEEESRYRRLFWVRLGGGAEAGGEEFGFEVSVGGCGAGGEEEGEGEDAFFGNLLLDFGYSQFLGKF